MKCRTIASAFIATLTMIPLAAFAQAQKPAPWQKTGQIEFQINYCGGNAGLLVHIPATNQQVILGPSGQGVFYFVVPGTYPLVVQIEGKPSYTIQNVLVESNAITTVNEAFCRDSDGDGFNEDVDCNDNNPNNHPGAVEVCDGADNNCDGVVDEGCFSLCTDGDSDGFFAQVGCGTQVDCDDTEATTSPVAPELCDGVDNNCNAQIDEGFDFQNDPNNCGACGETCASGVCTDGVCTPIGSPNGTACTSDGECLSGICADGYCCNNFCDSPCQSCGQIGSEGTCQTFAEGTDPETECFPYTCSGVASCLVSCISDGDCAPGYSCNVTGECVAAPVECTSCVDCNGQACNDGVCGFCSTFEDCCPALECNNGRCTLPGG